MFCDCGSSWTSAIYFLYYFAINDCVQMCFCTRNPASCPSASSFPLKPVDPVFVFCNCFARVFSSQLTEASMFHLYTYMYSPCTRSCSLPAILSILTFAVPTTMLFLPRIFEACRDGFRMGSGVQLNAIWLQFFFFFFFFSWKSLDKFDKFGTLFLILLFNKSILLLVN